MGQEFTTLGIRITLNLVWMVTLESFILLHRCFKPNVSYNHYLFERLEMLRCLLASWTLMLFLIVLWICINCNLVCCSTPSQLRPAEINVTGTRQEKNSHSSHSGLVTILNSLKSPSCQTRVCLKGTWADTCKCVKVSWWCSICSSTCTCVYTVRTGCTCVYICVYIYIYAPVCTCIYVCVMFLFK